MQRLEYLGHLVIQYRIIVDLTKAKVMYKCLPLNNIKELQMFLGMCNYYAKFVLQYAYVAS